MKIEIEIDQAKALQRYIRAQKPTSRRVTMLEMVGYWLAGIEDESPPPLGVSVSDAVVTKDKFG